MSPVGSSQVNSPPEGSSHRGGPRVGVSTITIGSPQVGSPKDGATVLSVHFYTCQGPTCHNAASKCATLPLAAHVPPTVTALELAPYVPVYCPSCQSVPTVEFVPTVKCALTVKCADCGNTKCLSQGKWQQLPGHAKFLRNAALRRRIKRLG